MKIRDDFNEYGTPVTVLVCEFCFDQFTVCPAVPDDNLDQWRGCMALECESYDPARDADKLFDDPKTIIIRSDQLN